jgi:AcrR family transcriptional regulator
MEPRLKQTFDLFRRQGYFGHSHRQLLNTPMPEPTAPPAAEDTRTRLLQAALSAFAHRDFDAVSVREIVERADANIAAVSYHFGGKKGLYLATAEYLADTMRQRIHPLFVPPVAGSPAGKDAAEQLGQLIAVLTRTLLLDTLGDDAAGFILREQLQPTAAFDILFEQLMQPMQQAFQALLTRLNPALAHSEYEQILQTHALIGQILAFRTARETLLRRLGRERLAQTDIDAIAAQILVLTLRAIDADQPTRTIQ